ncbi:MAG: lysophospholipid acyltransferase family protein [Betaproteobacteria bacterium]
MRASVFLRSSAYALFQVVVTPVFTVVALLTFPLPALTRYRVITLWSRIMVAAATFICGVRYRVLGAENIPGSPCVFLSKHQSAWETLALQVILPPHVWVLKRELLRIPFFGWGLAMLSPIAIERSAGLRALRQSLEQGRARIEQGFSIVIFPEGTRVPPGARGTYHPGGAWLAVKLAVAAVPIAHNAGELWPRNAFLKHPGLVTVSIGPALDTRNQTPESLNLQVEHWIETEMNRTNPNAATQPAAA